MIEYLAKALSVWLIGFFPLAEIYVAVPSGFALGLDPVSVVVWSVSGNYLPVLLIHFAYERVLRTPRLGAWLARSNSQRVKRLLDRHGFWFLALATPWIGVWIVAASVKALGMDARPMLLATFAGVLGYAIAIAVLIAGGMEALA
jgi:uncharacterized membrane protein